jgi:hypothetical protein
MGYNTDVTGNLKIGKDLSTECYIKLKTFMGADIREHPEWKARKKPHSWDPKNGSVMTHICFEITDDNLHIQWDGSEKFYDIPEKIKLIIVNMTKDFPNFILDGELICQGEKRDDRYKIYVVHNEVTIEEEEPITLKSEIRCPHCNKLINLAKIEDE